MTIFPTSMIRGLMIWGLMLMLTASVIAQIPARPSPPVLVNDFANLFSSDQKAALERKLVAFNDTKSVQIVVITQDGVKQELNQYTTEIGEQWGIGQDGIDNGVLIFIDRKSRKFYIATGSGTEGWLPDLLVRRIEENYFVEAFRAEQYYKGVDDATNVIMGLATGEYTAEDVKSPKSGQGRNKSPWRFLPFALILLAFFFFRRKGGGGGRGGGMAAGGWMFTGGGFGGYSGGGGGGGGSFGGFGGGGFSGGGAGGSW